MNMGDEQMDKLLARIERLEFHQRLLLGMIHPSGKEFDRLVVEKGLDEGEVEEFYALCEMLDREREKQKAEKFVFFSPLFQIFNEQLNKKLNGEEVITACIKQNIYTELMKVLFRNLN